ncbi:MAG: NrsF family protein, partial [Parasphingorhabdus sp.]
MSDLMIDRLVEDLTPVKPLKKRDGLVLTLLIAAVIAAAVVMIGGVRGDIMMGMPHPMFFLRGGALLLLGVTSSYAVIAMSQPAVGNSFKGWIWALCAALLIPVTAVVMAMIAAPDNMAIFVPRYGMEGLGISMLAGSGIA